jgi:hypothetical protein
MEVNGLWRLLQRQLEELLLGAFPPLLFSYYSIPYDTVSLWGIPSSLHSRLKAVDEFLIVLERHGGKVRLWATHDVVDLGLELALAVKRPV